MRAASGLGRTFRLTSVSAAMVPHDPANSLHKSKPVTFLTTLPPALNTSPVPLTPRAPNSESRTAPASRRRGPARLLATKPPMVPSPLEAGSPGLSAKRERSSGSQAKCCPEAANSSRSSETGVPVPTVSTSSAGS